jgi:hypothetical protein
MPALEIAGIAAIVVGVFVLGRSPLVTCTHRQAPAAVAEAVSSSGG